MSKIDIKNILVVEDNEDHYEIIEFHLEMLKQDIQIKHCKDGQEAIELSNSSGSAVPDLILLDMNLPKYSGIEVLQKIKDNQSWSHVPIVMFTTSGSETDIRNAFENGVNSYIQKPIEPEGMKKVLKNILDYWEENESIRNGD